MTGAAVRTVGLGARYGRTTVLDDVTLTIEQGAQVAITGRSGSGKTTLLLLLAGLVEPSAGAVAWPALSADVQERRRQVGLVFQAPSLVPELTAVENVALPLRLAGLDGQEANGHAVDALDAVGLGDAADALPRQLSGGMAQRTAIARAIAGRPLLLLADEPTGALDRRTAMAMVDLLRIDCSARGATLVVVTHDEQIAAALPRRLVLDRGRVLTGAPA